MSESKYDEENEQKDDRQEVTSPVSKSLAGRKLSGMLKKNKTDLLRQLFGYYQSHIFPGLEEFFDENVDTFDPHEEENKLIYTEVFHEYEGLLEGYIKDFIDDKDITPGQFVDELQNSLEQRKDRVSKALLNLVTAQSDFPFFVKLMKDKAAHKLEINARLSKK